MSDVVRIHYETKVCETVHCTVLKQNKIHPLKQQAVNDKSSSSQTKHDNNVLRFPI